jgi:predicted amidohydrolase
MQQNNLKIALIQIPSLPIEKAKLDYFLMMAREKKAKIAVLPEYTTNLFFKEMEHASIGLIEDQSIKQEENLKKLSTVYNISIVAPMVVFKSKKPYKTISIFSSGSVKHYYQYILMPYKHWNERVYFANELEEYKPFTFIVDGIKIAVMSGFEAHFDGVWQKVSEKKPDAVIIPCASTFESANRWRELFKVRAFTHSVYIIRANRVGEYIEPKHGAKWLFYGDSFVVDPFGEIEDALSDQEELLMIELSKGEVSNARRLWQFGKIGAVI